MKDVKQVSWLGALVLLAAGALPLGCSSTNGGGGTGGKGGGSATGGLGRSGHGGAGGKKACGGPPPSSIDAGVCQEAPCDGVIATFSAGDGGIPIMGGVTTWGGILKPTYTIDNGTLNIMETASQSNKPQYLGTTLYFNYCVDASQYSGVEFTVSGSVSAACHLIFGANDVVHDDKSSDPKGTCDAGTSCYAPNMMVAGTVSSTPDRSSRSPGSAAARCPTRRSTRRVWSACSGSSRSIRRPTAGSRTRARPSCTSRTSSSTSSASSTACAWGGDPPRCPAFGPGCDVRARSTS